MDTEDKKNDIDYSILLENMIKSEFPNTSFDLKGLLKWDKLTQKEIDRTFKKKGRYPKKQRVKYHVVDHFQNYLTSKEKNGNSFRNIYISEIEENDLFYIVIDSKLNMMGQKTRYKYQYLKNISSYKFIDSRLIMIR